MRELLPRWQDVLNSTNPINERIFEKGAINTFTFVASDYARKAQKAVTGYPRDQMERFNSLEASLGYFCIP